ncbi:MAG: AlpA family phage regulatory protein [Gammaproteobacteria bacterium]|nr:AlpA family phage regulatory protein [Gammaproteobacteria bacterium]MDH3466862.1 AlpA family phage regulatory protein [Gammaproteobacteria bacterium]
MTDITVLRKPAVRAKTGYSDQTIWRLERAGKFPTRIQLGANAVGWLGHEVDEWIEEKIEARDREAERRDGGET